MKNGRNLGLRLDPTTSAQLDAFEAQTKIQGATLARAALEAALEAYAKQGSIAFPLHVVTAKTQSDHTSTTHADGLAADIAHLTRQKAHLNEPESQYKAATGSKKKAS